MKNIVLIGMPGSGKTTLGRLLAEILERPFYDTDIEIESETRQTIPEIFARGEIEFRKKETLVIEKLAKLQGVIVATGGGAIKDKRNIEILKSSGKIVFIDRTPEDIIKTLKIEQRPLLTDGAEHIFKLYNERIALYNLHQDYTIKNEASERETLEKLLALVRREIL